MKFISTRGKSEPLYFSDALIKGLAPDGGLYVPENFPKITIYDDMKIHDILSVFFVGDKLEPYLKEICDKAFNFELPIVELNKDLKILELFHGPTCAFKDVGARFLAECFSKLAELDSSFKKTILVATSGDTGGAVAAAFHGKESFKIKLLFPHGGVSSRQEKQLTCWGDNIESFAVKGDFDKCQKMVKDAFTSDPDKYSSANSISIGRLLPQMVYYALTSLKIKNASFIVPTGNMGNVVACFWAKQLGFPINKVNIATNSNHSIQDYFSDGEIHNNKTIKTIANAMDVGNPSNIERLRYLFPDIKVLKEQTSIKVVSDSDIEKTIIDTHINFGYTLCPHTATAMNFYNDIGGEWIIVATAHPAKFETIIEPIINDNLKIPIDLEVLLSKKSQFKIVDELSSSDLS